MAESEDLPHLFPQGTATAEEYVSPRESFFKIDLPPRERQRHGNGLRSQLDSLLAAAQAMQSGASKVEAEARDGLEIVFRSSAGYELALESLEAQKAGIEVLTARRIGQKGQERTEAVVFVPTGRITHFYKLIDEYLTKDTEYDRPKNKKLVESIAEIRLAVVESLWTDDAAAFPQLNEEIWWEVWLRAGVAPERFRGICAAEGISLRPEVIQFPDRSVMLARTTTTQIAVPAVLDCVAELRRAKEVASTYTSLSPSERQRLAADFTRRIVGPRAGAPSVCVLDTGVNGSHPLLEPFATAGDLQSYRPEWGPNDDQGHGTEMAGLALFGDLAQVIAGTDPVEVRHVLESVKILPPTGQNPPELYGAITKESVARAELQAPERRRAVCMAVTTDEGRDRGQPSSWSAEVDALCAGADDDQRRLMLISAGNTSPESRIYYPNSNLTDGIHGPGQSWNALTVGAYTEMARIDDRYFDGWSPLAPVGDLAPSSTTSATWQQRWPLKPDIVLEGGNMAINPPRDSADHVDSMSLLTTYYRHLIKPFVTSGDTSAATALASRMAAQIAAAYPQLWPETVRALMVHSATWTDAMMKRVPDFRNRTDLHALMRMFGHGVPNLRSALWSARDALTLIVQDSLQPFTKRDNRLAMKEMHLHRLPWPVEQLRELGGETVEMRVTLSYFIEPNPARRGWTRRHRYASHGLRFDVNTPVEKAEHFRKRLNKAAWAEEEAGASTESDAKEWLLGPDLRHKGSIHSDAWFGTAEALAARGLIGVFPVIGWWRERPRHNRFMREARYALVVSIKTAATDVDLYTPVKNMISLPVEIS